MSEALRSRDDDLFGYTRLPWIAGIFLVPLTIAGTLVLTLPDGDAQQALILQRELQLATGGLPRRATPSPAEPALRDVIAPLRAGLSWHVRRGDTWYEIPAAPEVDEMRAWIASAWADSSPLVSSPPAPVRELLRERQRDIDQLVTLLVSRVPMRWDRPSRPGVRDVHHAHELLLASSLLHASDGRCDEATRSLHASWLLMSAWAMADMDTVAPHPERTAVIARKLAATTPGELAWMDASAFVDQEIARADWRARRALDLVVLVAADRHRAPPGLPTFFAHVAAANDSHRLLGRGRNAIRVGRALRDPSRCGRPLSWGDASATSPVGSFRELDRLVVQIELTRKLAELRTLQASDGTWPERVAGIEDSACHGLTWQYVGGTGMRLEPQGPALSWLDDRSGEPALRVVSR